MTTLDLLLPFLFGLLAGSVLTWLWITARQRWQRAQGLLKAPEKARAEKQKQTKKAREDVAKGRAELFRSILFFLLLVAMVTVVVVMVVNFL